MQAPVHILTGVIVSRIFTWRNYKPVALVLTFISCIILHAIFDKLAVLVYQPSDNLSDPIGLTYHIIMWLLSIVLLYVFWRDYKWGILFSLLPEIDWVIIGIQHLFQFTIPQYAAPWIHLSFNYVLNHIPPFNYTSQLPDMRNNPTACLGEFALILLLGFVIRAMIRYRKNIHF